MKTRTFAGALSVLAMVASLTGWASAAPPERGCYDITDLKTHTYTPQSQITPSGVESRFDFEQTLAGDPSANPCAGASHVVTVLDTDGSSDVLAVEDGYTVDTSDGTVRQRFTVAWIGDDAEDEPISVVGSGPRVMWTICWYVEVFDKHGVLRDRAPDQGCHEDNEDSPGFSNHS